MSAIIEAMNNVAAARSQAIEDYIRIVSQTESQPGDADRLLEVLRILGWPVDQAGADAALYDAIRRAESAKSELRVLDAARQEACTRFGEVERAFKAEAAALEQRQREALGTAQHAWSAADTVYKDTAKVAGELPELQRKAEAIRTRAR